MTNFAYASLVVMECQIQTDAAVRASMVYLEVQTQSNNPYARASAIWMEVQAQVQSPIRATGVWLEVQCQVLTYPTYISDGIQPWTIRPNWSDGVTERLKWKTDVLTSQSGYEQRRAIRQSPRREIEAKYTLIHNKRRVFDMFMMGPGQGLWRVPLWWEERHLYSAASAGDHFLAINTSSLECFDGDTVLVMGRNPLVYEMAVVHSVSDEENSLWLANSLQKSWPVGTSVFPLRTCYLTGSQSVSRMADDAGEVTLTFETTQANDYPPVAAPDVQLGDGNYANTWKPDYGQDVTTDYQRMMVEFDPDQGAVIKRDLALRSFRVMQFSYTVFNAGDHYAFRSFLYWLQGKLKPIYVQTNMRDMKLAAPSAANSTVLTIEAMDYAYFGAQANAGRAMILIKFYSGASLYVAVVSSLLNDDGTESVTVAQTFGTEVTSSTVQRIGFVELMRSDQDEIELMHHTDAQGATSIKMTFRSLQMGRESADYVPANTWTGTTTQDANPANLPTQQAEAIFAAITTDIAGVYIPDYLGGADQSAGAENTESESNSG